MKSSKIGYVNLYKNDIFMLNKTIKELYNNNKYKLS